MEISATTTDICVRIAITNSQSCNATSRSKHLDHSHSHRFCREHVLCCDAHWYGDAMLLVNWSAINMHPCRILIVRLLNRSLPLAQFTCLAGRIRVPPHSASTRLKAVSNTLSPCCNFAPLELLRFEIRNTLGQAIIPNSNAGEFHAPRLVILLRI